MARIIIAPEADADTDGIIAYLAADSTVTVLRIVHGRRRIGGNLLAKRD